MKAASYTVPLTWNRQVKQICRDREHSRGPHGLETLRVPFGVMKTFWNEIERMIAQHHESTQG